MTATELANKHKAESVARFGNGGCDSFVTDQMLVAREALASTFLAEPDPEVRHEILMMVHRHMQDLINAVP